ncbi:FAD-dependent oxidoreductase [Nonomuraea sp. NPDC050556]|uniref:FAD-dependent oxidoreductase n=1 Tax=Nonomuraea sp. NPDC050556 TaxID=3364369 RepID=UPI0037B2ECD9
MKTAELTDVLVIGSGFGGAIPAYHLAAGGAKVLILERGPQISSAGFEQDWKHGTWTRVLDLVKGDGMTALAGNCVGGGSVHYYAVSLRAPSFTFERGGGRMWPRSIRRATLDPWYERAEESLPVTLLDWKEVSYAGGLFAAACRNAGRTCQPVPVAVDTEACVNCGWMVGGCHFGAKRSMILNYLPAAQAHGAVLRPLCEVQRLSRAQTPGYRYRAHYGAEVVEAKVVIVAAGAMATPVLLRRSAFGLGGMPGAVGRYFSGNGDLLTVTQMDEGRIADVLGLEREPGIAYQAYPIGKSITTQSLDHTDPRKPEFTRFSIQQCYNTPLTNMLAEGPSWFGVGKKQARREWRSWLGTLAMYEDDNEGVFGLLPPTGAYLKLADGLGLSPLRYRRSANSERARSLVLAELRAILEKDGLGRVMPFTEDLIGEVTAHPLASARIGDDPATSACDEGHRLRGHEGLFVTDGSAVPGALCVNPSLTISALAERAVPYIVRQLRDDGVAVTYGAPAPGGATSGRRATLELAERVISGG